MRSRRRSSAPDLPCRSWLTVWPRNKYTMDKNGFARLKAFDARQTDDSTVVFTLQSDSSTFRQYPFDFLLSVKYRITGSALHVTLRVKNNSDTPMPAGLGLHPGFVWKRTGEPSRLVFSDPETVQAFRPDGKRYLLMDHENVLALTRDSFSRGGNHDGTSEKPVGRISQAGFNLENQSSLRRLFLFYDLEYGYRRCGVCLP